MSFKTLRVSKSKSTTCSPFFAESLVHSPLSSLNDSHSQREGGHELGVTMVLKFLLDLFFVSYRDKTTSKKQRRERDSKFHSCCWD